MELLIILASHGEFASAALDSLEMIAGKQPNIKAVALNPGDGLENLYQKMNTMVAKAEGATLILADIAGGTPANAATQVLLENQSIQVFAGFNLPLLLEIVMGSWQTLAEVSNFIEKSWSGYLTNINKKMERREQENEY